MDFLKAETPKASLAATLVDSLRCIALTLFSFAAGGLLEDIFEDMEKPPEGRDDTTDLWSLHRVE